MGIKIYKELEFEDLKTQCWSNALDTLRVVENANATEEFMDFIIEVNDGHDIDLIGLNDFLRFEDEYIFDSLNIHFHEIQDLETLYGNEVLEDAIQNFLYNFNNPPYGEGVVSEMNEGQKQKIYDLIISFENMAFDEYGNILRY